MRLEVTRKAHLALSALWALEAAEARTKSTQLAELIDTTPSFLSQVMASLVREGWVDSVPGKTGGYLLAVDTRSISLLEVIEAIEGPTDSNWCVLEAAPCPATARCALHDAWTRSRTVLMEILAARPVAGGPQQGGLL